MREPSVPWREREREERGKVRVKESMEKKREVYILQGNERESKEQCMTEILRKENRRGERVKNISSQPCVEAPVAASQTSPSFASGTRRTSRS